MAMDLTYGVEGGLIQAARKAQPLPGVRALQWNRQQPQPRAASHSWTDFITLVVSSPHLCYEGFQCIFPEAAEGFSHCYGTETAAHPHGTLQNCFLLLLRTPITSLSHSPVETHAFGIKHTASRLSPGRNAVCSAGESRGSAVSPRDRPISGQPCAAAAPLLQEIVENSFSRSSWLSVLKARFFLTLMLMDRT